MHKPLWAPSEERCRSANITRFIAYVNRRYGLALGGYDDIHSWSVGNIPDFWEAVWEFTGVRASQMYESVAEGLDKMPGTRWFLGAKLNFAENLLRHRDEKTALIFRNEAGASKRVSYAELYRRTAALAKSLRSAGVAKGDRVVGFMPNIIETVVAMLSATSIGALWSSCSPDFGVKGALDRFGQIKPKILFTADGYRFKGRKFDSLEQIAGLVSQLPSIEKVVVVPYIEPSPDISRIEKSILYGDFAAEEAHEIEFAALPFEHPVYIMYSSGTTGLPKCMVQSAGGVLINHLKELTLHADLKAGDRIFYYTTCGWMMWNWLVSAIALGATVVLYDGSAFYPDAGALWRIADEEEITVFGVSARYIAAIQNEGLKPMEMCNLATVKTILSTGSPLLPQNFRYVYENVKGDVLLSSISGGTDLNGCFAAGGPTLPVFEGEIQRPALGMNVHSFDSEGKPQIGRKGELVCVSPFPSMPVYFWNDPGGERYRRAYFDKFPNVWTHGDYVEITAGGGVIVYGRSDATLNPGGVRIGTAEIYRQIETLPEIADSILVGQRWQGDERIILFVKLAEGISLTEALKQKIARVVREGASPRHVPAKIIAVADIPYTISMKKVELAVRNIIHGEPVLNRDALANPDALDLYADIADIQT
ncbi:MAG: acetoacetate--CoA ligase [Deltaproteobacteria bacterium]